MRPGAHVDHRSGMDDESRTTDKDVIRAAFNAWSAGERPVTGVFADEMTWEITGRSRASRHYGSKTEFVEEVLVPFGRRFDEADPFRPVRIRGVFADPDEHTVVVVWDGRGTTVTGTTYENSYAWVMRLHDGLVVDGTAFYDSIAFDELWDGVDPADGVDAR